MDIYLIKYLSKYSSKRWIGVWRSYLNICSYCRVVFGQETAFDRKVAELIHLIPEFRKTKLLKHPVSQMQAIHQKQAKEKIR